jgi:hypothetical protein
VYTLFPFGNNGNKNEKSDNKNGKGKSPQRLTVMGFYTGTD